MLLLPWVKHAVCLSWLGSSWKGLGTGYRPRSAEPTVRDSSASQAPGEARVKRQRSGLLVDVEGQVGLFLQVNTNGWRQVCRNGSESEFTDGERDNYPLSVHHGFLTSPSSTKLLENKLFSFTPTFIQEILRVKIINGVEQKNTTGLFVSS